MKTLHTLAMLIMSATLLMIPLHVYGSTCAISEIPLTTSQHILLSSNVFVGTVTSIDNDTDHQWKVHFSIEKLWKGTTSQQSLTVMTNDLQGCGYSITTGGKYLVYASGFPPFLQTSWTRAYADAQNDIALLNDPNFQAQEKTKEELNKKLEAAKDKISNMMVSKTSDIPFNMVGVDELNSTLDIGIDSTKATMSEEEYQKKLKEILGDIPIKIEFGQIVPLPKTPADNFIGNNSIPLIMSPLKQFKSGTISIYDVKCIQGFVRLIKTSDGSPACVKPQTAQKLVERGWGSLLEIPISLPIRGENNGTLSGDVALAGGPVAGPKANYEVDVYATDGVTIVAKTLTDANAHYSIQLPAGNYIIYAPDYPNKQTHLVSVFSGKNTIFNISYGSGYK